MNPESDEQESGPTNVTLSEWDRVSIILFAMMLSCAGVFYWIFVADIFAPILCFMALIVLYHYGVGEPIKLNAPLGRMRFPFREGSIALILFIDWALLLQPVMGSDIRLAILGTLLFGFVLPYAFLAVGVGYRRQSLGLCRPHPGTNGLVLMVCAALLVPSILQVVLSPVTATFIYSRFLSFMAQVLYLGIVVGVVEEFVFRGILQSRLAFRLKSRTLGILGTSSLFAVMHVFSVLWSGEVDSIMLGSAIIYAFVTRLPLGIILGIVWNESESLLGVSTIHATNNVAVLLRAASGF